MDKDYTPPGEKQFFLEGIKDVDKFIKQETSNAPNGAEEKKRFLRKLNQHFKEKFSLFFESLGFEFFGSLNLSEVELDPAEYPNFENNIGTKLMAIYKQGLEDSSPDRLKELLKMELYDIQKIDKTPTASKKVLLFRGDDPLSFSSVFEAGGSYTPPQTDHANCQYFYFNSALSYAGVHQKVHDEYNEQEEDEKINELDRRLDFDFSMAIGFEVDSKDINLVSNQQSLSSQMMSFHFNFCRYADSVGTEKPTIKISKDDVKIIVVRPASHIEGEILDALMFIKK